MKKVLFIAYQFPPMGGPGVQRSTRFVQYLRKYGYEPIVLTINAEDIVKMGSQFDESLLDYIPENTQIERIGSAHHFKLNRFLIKFRIYRIFWYFLYPFFWEKSAGWPSLAYPVAKKLIQENEIDLVYTSSGPFSTLLLGKKLKKNLNIKWVADMRDPFTDAYAWSYPSKWHWQFSRMMEKRTLNSATHLIVNTNEVKKLYLEREILNASKITVLTNGY